MSTSEWVPHLEQDKAMGPPFLTGGGGDTLVAAGRARAGRAAGGRGERTARLGAVLSWGLVRAFFLGARVGAAVVAAENRAWRPGRIRFSGRRGPASWRSAGAQNNARLPRGSGESGTVVLPGARAVDQPTRHASFSSSRARAR
jgi:hypothetical protein